jgi:quercetin 2,3-dioxygenase
MMPIEGHTAPSAVVRAGHDRFEQERRVFGTLPITRKVSSQDTGGNLLIVEQNNLQKGGPPRHLHLAQEEWFYVICGEYLVEIGGEKHRLTSGDSLLAPRKVPHTWAYTGQGEGTLLITFLPAGQMESFFDEATRLTGLVPQAELSALFTAHGMQLTGPPIDLD